MNPGRALDRIHADLAGDLRVFAVVREDEVDVTYVRTDIDRALEGATTKGAHQTHLRDIATAMLSPGGTASIRYTPDAIVVGMPAPDDDGTGYLLSLEYTASEAVDEFIETLLDDGATLIQSTVSGPAAFAGSGESPRLND